jgi:tetratricopeptide (TPR) repeat protein
MSTKGRLPAGLWLAFLLIAAPVFSQDAQKRQPANTPGVCESTSQSSQKCEQPAQPSTIQPLQIPDEINAPEEDATVAPRKYAFDPLEAQRCISIGNFYFKKGTKGYRAALGRYEDATKYDPNSAEAFFKVGEVEEKLNNKDAAKIAFERAVKLAPDSKFAKEARKKLGIT